MLKILLAAIVLVGIAVLGLAIRLLFDKKAEFSGGSCQATNSSDALRSEGISCGCGGGECVTNEA